MHSLLLPDDEALLDWASRQQSQQVRHLIELCDINSGSFNISGVNHCGQQAATLFADRLGVAIAQSQPTPWQTWNMEGEPYLQPLAKVWRLRKRPQAALRLLLTGHLDTIFPPQSQFDSCHYKDPDLLTGPGCQTKGGLLIMLTALELLERSTVAEKIGWTVLLTPDGEIGSPGSMPVLIHEAAAHQLGDRKSVV